MTHLNFSLISDDGDFCILTQKIAADLRNYPYRTIGDFMKSMTDEDLATLNALIDDSYKGSDKAIFNVVAITELLAYAEGLGDVVDIDEDSLARSIFVKEGMAMLASFAVATSLARKGLCRAMYENMTFDTSGGDLPIAESL